MEKYKIVFKKSVSKDFRSIPPKMVKQILSKIDRLADTAFQRSFLK